MIRLLSHLERHSISYLLIGGRGLEAHGYVRNTLDLDLLLPLGELGKMRSLLLDYGYAVVAETSIFSRWMSSSGENPEIDLLYVDAPTFKKLEADAVSCLFGETVARVPSVAGMVALKLHAMRNNPDRRPRDLQDIIALRRLHPDAFDLAELRALCERYGPAGIFESILSLEP